MAEHGIYVGFAYAFVALAFIFLLAMPAIRKRRFLQEVKRQQLSKRPEPKPHEVVHSKPKKDG